MGFTPAMGSVLGMGVSAAGSFMQASQAKAAYNYNAGVLQTQASEVEAEGALKQKEISQEEEVLRSTQAAAYARAGVKQSGSALDVMLDSATDYEFDKLVASYNTKVSAMNLRSQADIQKFYGKQTMSNAFFGVGTSLLQGSFKMGDYMSVPTHNTEGIQG